MSNVKISGHCVLVLRCGEGRRFCKFFALAAFLKNTEENQKEPWLPALPQGQLLSCCSTEDGVEVAGLVLGTFSAPG